MQKLSLKNSDNLTADEAFADFKGHCRIKNLSGESSAPNGGRCEFQTFNILKYAIQKIYYLTVLVCINTLPCKNAFPITFLSQHP